METANQCVSIVVLFPPHETVVKHNEAFLPQTPEFFQVFNDRLSPEVCVASNGIVCDVVAESNALNAVDEDSSASFNNECVDSVALCVNRCSNILRELPFPIVEDTGW